MRLTFGDVSYDSGPRQIRRGETEVRLTRKAFELLTLLLEKRPNAVSKEDIHARLWPETFVSEGTLQRLVFEVREAIGDDARNPRFLRTVHAFGYAFSGPVVELADADQSARRIRAWLVGEIGRLPVFEGENVLGRDEADVLEIESPTVSRRHARIVLGDTATVEDLGSKNGTFVGNRRIGGANR